MNLMQIIIKTKLIACDIFRMNLISYIRFYRIFNKRRNLFLKNTCVHISISKEVENRYIYIYYY